MVVVRVVIIVIWVGIKFDAQRRLHATDTHSPAQYSNIGRNGLKGENDAIGTTVGVTKTAI